MPVTSEKREDRIEVSKIPQTLEEMEEYDRKIFESKTQPKKRPALSKLVLGKTYSNDPISSNKFESTTSRFFKLFFCLILN